MRVLIVNTYYYPEMVGGAEHSVKKLAEHLIGSGVECAVLCTGAVSEDAFVEGVPVFRRRMKKRDRVIDLAGASKPVRLIHELQNTFCLQNAQVIGEVLDAWRPDVIHTNGVYDISPVVWLCARRRGIAVVHTLRDYSLLCPRVSLVRKGQSRQCDSPYIWCRAYQRVNRFCTRWVNAVTAPSGKTLSTLLERKCFPKAQSQVIFNAIEQDEKTAEVLQKRLSQPPKEEFRIVFLGELSEKKGLQWLLSSFSELKDSGLRLTIAGRGPMEELVKQTEAQDSRVRYAGFLNEAQVGALLDESDVLVCPSLWQEPFGRVVIDAYKHAIPVISSDMGAFPEIVSDGVTGIVVPAQEPAALKDALMAYRSDHGRWASACRNAAAELKRFSMEEQISAFIRLYQKCIRSE